ncbi:mismatch repair endonuclease pms2 [Stylonychia lemnae]|uniref:Mismatch repair endonuclease pms2 n=1 Tax=Stylonychia lemnae TaxID=5949 RepID=A0A077ZT90_STYLE|nr:mismatch repair endonuclease pms2 [Stylonychia lemnae]|eukprot:CDW73098.1 mismatch repair endonuclease pms2 [Stylonychia lemnae]
MPRPKGGGGGYNFSYQRFSNGFKPLSAVQQRMQNLKLENLDNQLRIWLSQLVENSIHMNAKTIEIKLIQKGTFGFDVVDDGLGIDKSEFENLCQYESKRQYNQIYKTRSLGWRGEALHSLSQCSELKVITRKVSQKTGFEVTYVDGKMVKVIDFSREFQGTTVQVRAIHKNNSLVQKSYQKNKENHYNNANQLLLQFSQILFDTQMSLSNEFVDLGSCSKYNNFDNLIYFRTLKVLWETTAPGNQRENIIMYLNQIHNGTPFKMTSLDLIEFSTFILDHQVQLYMIRPYTDGIIVNLHKRHLNQYFNCKPCELPMSFKSLFYEIYNEYKVKPTSQPYVFVHFQCNMDIAYEIENQMDIRRISFNNETIIAQELKLKVKEYLSQINSSMTFTHKSSTPQKPNGLQSPQKLTKQAQKQSTVQVVELEPDSGSELQQIQDIQKQQVPNKQIAQNNQTKSKQVIIQTAIPLGQDEVMKDINDSDNENIKEKTNEDKIMKNSSDSHQYIPQNSIQKAQVEPTIEVKPQYASLFELPKEVKEAEKSLFAPKNATYAEICHTLKKPEIDEKDLKKNELKKNKTYDLTMKFGASLVVNANFNGNTIISKPINNTASTCSKTATPQSLNNEPPKIYADLYQDPIDKTHDSDKDEEMQDDQQPNSQRSNIYRDHKIQELESEYNYKITIISRKSPTKAQVIQATENVIKQQLEQKNDDQLQQQQQLEQQATSTSEIELRESVAQNVKQELSTPAIQQTQMFSQAVYLDFGGGVIKQEQVYIPNSIQLPFYIVSGAMSCNSITLEESEDLITLWDYEDLFTFAQSQKNSNIYIVKSRDIDVDKGIKLICVLKAKPKTQIDKAMIYSKMIRQPPNLIQDCNIENSEDCLMINE